MDFADFGIAGAEKSEWFHLKSPADEPFYMQDDQTISTKKTDKPCRILLRGVAEPEVVAALEKITHIARVYQWKEKRAKDKDLPALAEAEDRDYRAAVKNLMQVAIQDWENIAYDGEVRSYDTENLLLMFTRTENPRSGRMFQTVYDELTRRRDFFPSAAEN